MNLVQSDLSILEEWSRIWQLPSNVKKCKAMHFGHKNPNKVYHLGGQELEVIDSEKDLGVMVEDKFKFHVLGVIKRTYRTGDAVTMTILYRSMVCPHL